MKRLITNKRGGLKTIQARFAPPNHYVVATYKIHDIVVNSAKISRVSYNDYSIPTFKVTGDIKCKVDITNGHTYYGYFEDIMDIPATISSVYITYWDIETALGKEIISDEEIANLSLDHIQEAIAADDICVGRIDSTVLGWDGRLVDADNLHKKIKCTLDDTDVVDYISDAIVDDIHATEYEVTTDDDIVDTYESFEDAKQAADSLVTDGYSNWAKVSEVIWEKYPDGEWDIIIDYDNEMYTAQR